MSMPYCLLARLLTRWYEVKKRSYGSVQDRIKMYGNRIKVSKIVKSAQDYSDSNLHSRNTFFWLKKVVKKSIAGMKT